MNWDEYFLRIAKEVAGRSHCLSRQIGAILVKNRSIISTGYNGPPRGFTHCEGECPRQAAGFKSGDGLHLCPAVHAEVNAIANAARIGVSTKNTTMYLTCNVPCKDCLAVIINAGITGIVVQDMGDFYDTLSKEMAQYIYLREYDVVQEWGVWYSGGVGEGPCWMMANEDRQYKHTVAPDRYDPAPLRKLPRTNAVFYSAKRASKWIDEECASNRFDRSNYTVIPYKAPEEIEKWGIWYPSPKRFLFDSGTMGGFKTTPDEWINENPVFYSKERAELFLKEWKNSIGSIQDYTVVPYNNKMYWIECNRPGNHVKAGPSYTKKIGSVTDGYHDGSPIFKTPARARAWMDAVDKQHLSRFDAKWSNEAHKIVEFLE